MSGRYAMNSRPDSWPRPDEVDVIQAAERWEATEDFEDAALQWGINDADILAEIADRFTQTALYEQEFNRWMDRQAP